MKHEEGMHLVKSLTSTRQPRQSDTRLRLDIPLSALEAKVDFSLQILSSVAASGLGDLVRLSRVQISTFIA